MNDTNHPASSFRLLSELLLAAPEQALRTAATLNSQDWESVRGLANLHHVLIRSFSTLQQLMDEKEGYPRAAWAASSLEKESVRIHHAVSSLGAIVQGLEQCGKVVVIKSFDHWPDLGSDLDLFINADAADVVAIMRKTFNAQVAKRSWGDRLANKWNFMVPELPELVEIHVGRLGQTGEQVVITESLLGRARKMELGGSAFRIPAPEDRLIISTLQRMYRHFYLRLCDIVDTAQLLETGGVDYVYLHTMAQSAGLWEGVATYLAIVSDYVKKYRGEGIALPSWVQAAARFGGDELHFRRNWLRVPIVPQSAQLFAAEWRNLLGHGDIRNTLRLSLLPCLATAAVLEYKLTGSDKGIW